ncbi:hypothetical protein BGX27_002595 [Mortierella sp. AM989]|nr:hypothetical protein BGX27_002595 [Mortierella sp. AM989]
MERDAIPSPHGPSGPTMETLSSNWNTPQNNLRAISIQPYRRTDSQDGNSTGMEYRPEILQPTPESLGTASCGPVRIPNQHETTTVYDLAPTSTSCELRRSPTPMETTGEPLHLPPMESHPADSTETPTRMPNGDDHSSSMDQCHLDSETNGTAAIRRGEKRTRQASSLDPPGMARKRLHYTELGVSADAATTILDNPQACRRAKTYGPAQHVFIDWVAREGKDNQVPDPIVVINYLAYQIRTINWSSSTVQAKRSAILNLFPDKTPITDNPVYQAFMTAIKFKNIRPAHVGSVDISPALEFLRSLPKNDDLPFLQLSRKLGWLLGVCGFFAQMTYVASIPIGQNGTPRPNNDAKLCPVAAYSCYLTRTADYPLEIAHPKDNSIKYAPLQRNSRHLNKPLLAETISNQMDTISYRIPELERATRRVKPRALGSTLTAEAGIPIDDIIAHGNWSSPSTFQKIYRIASETRVNFTEVALGQNSGVAL